MAKSGIFGRKSKGPRDPRKVEAIVRFLIKSEKQVRNFRRFGQEAIKRLVDELEKDLNRLPEPGDVETHIGVLESQRAGYEADLKAKSIPKSGIAHVTFLERSLTLKVLALNYILGLIKQKKSSSLPEKKRGSDGEPDAKTGRAVADEKDAAKGKPGERDPQDLKAAMPYFKSARRLAKKDRADEAIEKLLHALTILPDFTEAILLLGDMYLKVGLDKEAAETYRRCLPEMEDSAELHQKLGKAYLAGRDGRRALPHLKRAVRHDPAMLDAYCDLGIACILMDQSDKAMLTWNQVLKLDNGHVRARKLIGDQYRLHARHDLALNTYKMIGDTGPDDGSVIARMAECYAALDRFDEALPLLKKALSVEPDRCELHNAMGSLLARRGELNVALVAYEEALKCRPDSADVLFNIAAIYYKKENFKKAGDYCRRALLHAEDDVECKFMLANCEAALGNLVAARELYVAMLDENPDSVEARTNLSFVGFE
ncbi:MAG: tetratricopeptide repeat protein [Planctomycetota bacterium]|nr:MAG: tetratricopeptide repeat protein [Planctomycetota bacterium]